MFFVWMMMGRFGNGTNRALEEKIIIELFFMGMLAWWAYNEYKKDNSQMIIRALLLLIGLAWGRIADSLIVDETFFDNGNLKHQRFYKDGKADGKWTHYYNNGNIWIEGNYNKGIQVGLWTTYYKNGQWTNRRL